MQMPFQKQGNNKKDSKKNEPKIVSQLVGTIIMLLIFVVGYSLIVKNYKEIPEVSMSEIAKGVSSGEIKKIEVSGEKLTATFKDDTIKKSKKETESSLSETLANYGVKPEQLSLTEISVKSESGFGYFLLN